MRAEPFEISAGSRLPVGAAVADDGVNFCVFSRHATAVSLVIYARAEDTTPLQVVDLDPAVHKTFFFWHVFVAGAQAGLYYTWRVAGPYEPESGLRFDAEQELLDPWARIVSDRLWDRRAQSTGQHGAIRACVAERDGYDWEGDTPLRRDLEESIIYELHVRGFTEHGSSGVQRRGTYAGLMEKIPYLQSLGITDVELLPVFAFDRQDVPDAVAARGLENYWGYSPYAFFAPHPHFAAGADVRSEFRDMVKALHRARIGVILDVVLNHTCEGGAGGVTLCFKGLGNEFFYHLDPSDLSQYRDFTGCGNTINCNHPLVAHLLVQCLEFWVREMHVDGFRLDLASVLSRGEDGEPMQHAPVLWSIEFSRVLSHTHLIAEAWDAAGLHQLGDFPGFRWSEWNGRYRDVARCFIRGDTGMRAEMATRLAGSSDLFGAAGGHPVQSINFVTCHDGFTLYDLLAYSEKHNEANGEDNRDGSDHNFSDNCGVEGVSDDAGIEAVRQRRARNFMLALLLSQGVPMILAGDERLRTQRGNNNAYCQDNDLSWLDWTPSQAADDMFRFTRLAIELRKRHVSLRRRHFIAPPKPGSVPELQWYGAGGSEPDWQAADERVLCFSLAAAAAGEAELFVAFNMDAEQAAIELPVREHGVWRRLADTSLPAGEEILPPERAVPLDRQDYALAADSVAVFERG